MEAIPYGRQNITEDDITAMTAVLKSEYLTQGPRIAEFEKAFADYIGSSFAVAVSNGTAALHLSAIVMNVTNGQKVITSPITFAASANCIRYCGGEVVFADIDPETNLLDINEVRKLLEDSPKGTFNGIVPVEFAGRAVDLEEFRQLADEFGLWLIEDACHAPGGYFLDSSGNKQNCGNGIFADVAIFSFHPVKHIACGEGGMITTNDEDIYKRLLTLRTHGIIKDNESFKNKKSFAAAEFDATVYPGWYMEMQELGYNYRLTDMQAALGTSQLKRASEGLERRKEIAQTYFEAFKDEKFVLKQSGSIEGHAYHLYVIEVENRLALYNHLREQQVYAQIHYIPTHLMPYYREQGYKEGDFPKAEDYYKCCLSLPMYPTLRAEEQSFVIEAIKGFYNA